MVYRKLIKFGNSSLVVSLPSKWIKRHDLEKGDTIQIEENENEIILSPELSSNNEKPSEITISANEKILTLYDLIIAAYINNYNTIIITGEKLKEKSKEIRSIIHGLVGMEILEQTSTKIIAKDFLDVKDVSIKSIIRRIDNITRSMVLDTEICIEKGIDNQKHVADRDHDVNRLTILVYKLVFKAMQRPQMAKIFDMTYIELLYMYHVAEKIEHIADQVKRICKYCTILEKKYNKKELLNLFKLISNQYFTAMKALYSQDYKIADEVLSRKKNLMNVCEAFLIDNKNIFITKIVEKMINMNTFACYIARSVLHSHPSKA
ncbi:phosphate uptake regulator PhoU [Candidatus Woesearchaeota archaeon]|nr:MAG: phosphate uptake regulator PhoU [Candidatus Woesearchaeota archaeon]